MTKEVLEKMAQKKLDPNPAHVTTAVYRASNHEPIELDPLPEDGTNLGPSPTGRCEAPNTNCKGIGKGYLVTFITDEGEKKRQVFLVWISCKKGKK